MFRATTASAGLILATSILAAPAQADHPASSRDISGHRAHFTLDNTGSKAKFRKKLNKSGFTYERSASGREAVVDESFRNVGAISAAGRDFVDISWKADRGVESYTIQRDGVFLAHVSSADANYHDTDVKSGETHRYTILPDADVSNVRSLVATVPVSKDLDSPTTVKQVETLAANHGSSSTLLASSASDPVTTVTWTAFIPQKYVDAPPVGCDYGSGYKFGGDDRGFDWKSSRYRTAVNATIHWMDRSVVSNTSIGESHVYKSDGTLVAHKTADGSKTYAKKMAYDAYDTVAVRLVTHAGNPFCSAGAIDGAVNMLLTTHGNWNLISGVHRDMPSHQIYIWHAGKVTDVYRKTYANTMCLLGNIACPEVKMSPKSGKFV